LITKWKIIKHSKKHTAGIRFSIVLIDLKPALYKTMSGCCFDRQAREGKRKRVKELVLIREDKEEGIWLSAISKSDRS
jgi:hypothetical protein